MRRSDVLGAAVFLSLFGGTAAGQGGTVTLRGVVTDTGRAPIENVSVSIPAQKLIVETDGRGRFRIRGVNAGEVQLMVRRLGYDPREMNVLVAVGSDSITVRLVPQPAVLDVVNVSTAEKRRRQGIEDFHKRRINGTGTYITRAEILKRNSFEATDVFRAIPGVRIVRTVNGPGVRFSYQTKFDARADCPPMIWIDGQRAPGMEVSDVPLTDVEGIEIYRGPASVPMQFSQSLSPTLTCGTIVIWTKPPPSR
jgi:hypothetical protein